MPSGFDNDVMYADNVDFSGGSPVSGKVTTDGQLLIGSTAAPNIRVATLTAGTGVAITNGAGSITIALSGTGAGQTITGDTGGALTPTAGNWNIVSTSTNGIQTTGSGSTLTVAMASPYGDGSFAFTRAASGATNTLTVENSSNTASSNALSQITVGGTSAGDAFQTFTVTGTTNWSHGIDNSVAGDPYVLAASNALGTTNIMVATTAGEITKPLQPAFLAEGAGGTDVTGDGTVFVVGSSGAWSEIYDQNSDFNTNGTFTAPVTGKYFFTANILINGLLVAHTSCDIRLVASNRSEHSGICSPFANADNLGNYTMLISCLMDMDAADTCNVSLQVANGGKVVDINNGFAPNVNFSGFLAC